MACAAIAKHISTFGHKRNQRERPSGERSGLAMVDVCWPERGRMHVAGGKNTGQPDRDLGPHSRTIKDSREYYCALVPKSPPTIYKRLAGAHTQKISRRNGGGGYSSCHSALRKAATRSLRSAGLPQFSTNCAIPLQHLFFIQFSLSSCGVPRTRAQDSRHSHGTICIAPIILENLLLHAYNVSLKKNATMLTHKGGELDLIKG